MTSTSSDPFEKRLVGFIDWFIVHDREQVEAALKMLDGVEPTGEGEWSWHETFATERRLVAELAYEGKHLVLEATREADAERCGSWLRNAAGAALEFMIGEVRYELVRSGEPE